MTRRGLFSTIFAAIAGAVAAKVVPLPPCERGVTLRYRRSYSGGLGEISRLDILYGLAPIHPELMVRVMPDTPFFDPHLDPIRLPV